MARPRLVNDSQATQAARVLLSMLELYDRSGESAADARFAFEQALVWCERVKLVLSPEGVMKNEAQSSHARK